MQKSPSLQASWDAGRVSTASLVANPCLRDAAAGFKREGETKVSATVPWHLQLQREGLGTALLPPFWRQSWGHCPPASRGRGKRNPGEQQCPMSCTAPWAQHPQIQPREQRTSLLPPSPAPPWGIWLLSVQDVAGDLLPTVLAEAVVVLSVW